MSHQVDHDGRASTRTDEQLRLLREALYRPHPPADAVARYRALAAQARVVAQGGSAPQALPDASRTRAQETGTRQHGTERTAGEQDEEQGRGTAADAPGRPGTAEGRHPRRRFGRRTLLLGGAVGLVVLTLVGVLQGTAARGPVTAEPVVPVGRTASIDRAVLARVLHPGYSNSDALVEAVRHSDLAQLRQWRSRAAGAAVMQGIGPVVRRYGSGSLGTAPPRPFSLLVVCDRPARYRWTVRGSTPLDGEDHVLAAAVTDRCGHLPTAAGFTLPAGAVVHRFTLSLPKDRSWGMVFVYPMG